MFLHFPLEASKCSVKGGRVEWVRCIDSKVLTFEVPKKNT